MVNGESHYFLGRRYRLLVHEQGGPPRRHHLAHPKVVASRCPTWARTIDLQITSIQSEWSSLVMRGGAGAILAGAAVVVFALNDVAGPA